MTDLVEITKKAKEIYELGIYMKSVFSADEDDKGQYMIMAIAAGLKQDSKPFEKNHDFTQNFGETMKIIRKEKGITLRQIEDATGVSNSYLSQLESGKVSNPIHFTFSKVTNFLINGKSVEKSDYPSSGLLPNKPQA